MKNKLKIIPIVLIGLIIIIIASYFLVKEVFMGKNKTIDDSYNQLEPAQQSFFMRELVDIEEYKIYGNHFNLKGKVALSEDKNMNDNLKYSLVLLNSATQEEIELDCNKNIDNNTIEINTSEEINEGINLENIPIGKYSVYFKEVEANNNHINYYSLKNMSEDGDLDYYTITKNGKNNYIKIYWEGNNLKLSCNECELPENVYDIVIDQGHGGKSTGAIDNGYTESHITYEYGIKLKEALENLGLKVLITRTDINETLVDYNKDGKEGRAVVPNSVRAKYCFSIHINYNQDTNRDGFEIYAPNLANLDFAQNIADNIVNIAATNYSQNEVGYVSNGVYVLTFDEETIESVNEDAIDYGYEPYNTSLNTNMFFMIREVGGRATGGYIDGRDERTGVNPYCNSNCTAEGYLLELGYISNYEDIQNVVNNKENFVNAIVTSIKKELNI